MSSLEAVFWDVDGTIADTEMQGHRKAFNNAFRLHGLNWLWDETQYQNLLRIPGGVNRIEYFCNKQDLDVDILKIRNIHKTKTDEYQKILHTGKIKIRTGVMRLIEELNKKNVKQYIVTTGQKLSLESLLQNLFDSDDLPFVDFVTGTDVNYQKPHPEPYLKALSIADVNPSAVVVIEDSVVGLTSSHNAGLPCLITLTEWNTDKISQFSNAQSIVDRIGDYESLTTVIRGPAVTSFVDHSYLTKLINTND